MSKKIRFDYSKNPAINFSPIVEELKKISKELNISMPELISAFMVDIQNYNKEGYEKKVNIPLNGERRRSKYQLYKWT